MTLLYLLVTTGYYLACNYATITNTETDIGMAVNFGPKVFSLQESEAIADANDISGIWKPLWLDDLHCDFSTGQPHFSSFHQQQRWVLNANLSRLYWTYPIQSNKQ